MASAESRTRVLLGLGDNDREVEEQDYLEADFEEPWRYELHDGRLAVMSPNSEEHDDSADPWRDRLYHHRRTYRGVIQKIVPEAWVRIRPKHFRIGDIGVYLVGARPKQRRPARAPELMIEILSPGQDSLDRDFVAKRFEYHTINILEYLIVDRRQRRVHVLSYEPEGYTEHILTNADIYTTPLLPGLIIPLAEVLEEG